MGHVNGMKLVLPPYSPAWPVGSLCPYLFRHICHRQSCGGSYPRTMDLVQMDPIVHEQLALLIYVLNNGGMVFWLWHFPHCTPFPRPQYNPWTYLQMSNAFSGRHQGIAESTVSICLRLSYQLCLCCPLVKEITNCIVVSIPKACGGRKKFVCCYKNKESRGRTAVMLFKWDKLRQITKASWSSSTYTYLIHMTRVWILYSTLHTPQIINHNYIISKTDE